MKFRKIRLMLLGREIEKSDFYEDITFQNDFVMRDVKKSMTKWLWDLQNYKQIKVGKFKDLFCKLKEVVFPVKIEYCIGHVEIQKMLIIDSEGKSYYFIIGSDAGDYFSKMNNYIIWSKESSLEPLVEREFNYTICKNGNIELFEMIFVKLKKSKERDNEIVSFYNNCEKGTTKVIFKSSYKKESNVNNIKIKYSMMNDEFDRKVLDFLFYSVARKWYFYNVSPILDWFITMIQDEKITISIIAEVENEVCSQIEVVNGVVQIYTKTEIIDEGEMHINKKIFAKNLEEFLAENREL